MKKMIGICVLASLSMFVPSSAGARINAVTTTPDLAEFVTAVGGRHVEVYSINRGDRDPHYVEIRPSYMLKVRKADILFKVGLELDEWIDGIIDGSRNNRLQVVDCSARIVPLEIPSFKPDARHGDLHQFGNPHYWLSPDNVPAIIQTIVESLTDIDPEHGADYQSHANTYLETIEAARAQWEPLLEKLREKKVIFYHNSWPYFAEFAGIDVVGFVEPKPGVPPSPGHLRKLIEKILARGVSVIAIEPYFDRNVPEMLARKTGAAVVTVYPSIGGNPGIDSYPALIEHNLRILAGENP